MPRVLKYNEAVLKITKLIKDLNLKINDRLPTEQDIAKSLGMSIAPIRQAMAELQSKGVIRKMPGVGTFFCGNLKTDNCRFLVGLVNVDDHFFPNGAAAYELRSSLQKHDAECRFFNVPRDVDASLLDELNQCDRFIITGFVNDAWVRCLQNMNKPIVELGVSDYGGPICRVEHDWAKALETAVTRLKDDGYRTIMFLVQDPLFNANARNMREFFLDSLAGNGITPDYDAAPFITYSRSMGDIRQIMQDSARRPDAVIVAEPGGNLFPTLMAVNSLGSAMPALVILQEKNLLSPDAERWIPNLYNVLFKENIMEVTVRILYEFPYRFIEECNVYRIEPEIGCGRSSVPIPLPYVVKNKT